jgi:GTP-binding protein LepA
MEEKNIRNFCIIAHIDHGKSTLADRFLELTKTVEERRMREQFLDQMELERERGITIKMQPVRMIYAGKILNLIDTPGHIDFSYEVSRALKAVEGAVLLIDAAQGVQAQTITNVEIAKNLGLVIIPVINKIDLASAQIGETKEEIKRLLPDWRGEIFEVSAKTGQGVKNLLDSLVKLIPPPKYEFQDKPRALVFDFEYSSHQGIIVYVKMTDGFVRKGQELYLNQAKEKFIAAEVGIFSPERRPVNTLSVGEIGYLVTNIKKPNVGLVGDTIVSIKDPLPPLTGYLQPKPVVWASIYPKSKEGFNLLHQSLDRLHLSDSSLSYEEENNPPLGGLGRGFRCGFLGMLHLEIVVERLKREFGLDLIVATPTITYKIQLENNEEKEIYSPISFPDENLIKRIFEPWVEVQIILSSDKIGVLIPILHEHEANLEETSQLGGSTNRAMLRVEMPLRELMRNFFEELKSATSGYGSLGYKLLGPREVPRGKLCRLDILVANEPVPALAKITVSSRVEREAREMVEKLSAFLPRALFAIKIQAKARGRIIASRTLPALKKDVTGYLYGGDITRKKKLWEKQKRGKKKLQERGKVNIPHDVFIKMIQR